MKIRPKPRNYNKDDLDESYFAARSDGNCSKDDNNNQIKNNSDILTSKIEFKIFNKKTINDFSSNEIKTSNYINGNFFFPNLIE